MEAAEPLTTVTDGDVIAEKSGILNVGETEEQVNSEDKVKLEIELPEIDGYKWNRDMSIITESNDIVDVYQGDTNSKWIVEGFREGYTEVKLYAHNEEGLVEEARSYCIYVDKNLDVRLEGEMPSTIEGIIPLEDMDSWTTYELTDNDIAEVYKYDEKFIIHGTAPGTTKLRITRDPSGTGNEEDMESRVYVVTVDANLNVTVEEDM